MQFTSPTPLLYHPSTKTSSVRHQSLLSLCSWWDSTHPKEEPLPHICYQYTSPQRLNTGIIAPPMEFNFARVASDMLLDRGDGEHEAAKDVVDVEHSVHSVGRSIGLVGIGLGVLVMLLIIAFITCLRRRKVVQSFEEEFHRGAQVVLSVTDSRRLDTPPAYNLVVRDTLEQEEVEEEPPSYAYALGQETDVEKINSYVEELPPNIVETYEIDTHHETDLDNQKSDDNLCSCILYLNTSTE